MKKLFTTLILLCISIIVEAQPVLYGLTSGYNNNDDIYTNNGTISKYDPSTNTLSAAFKFSDDGRKPKYGNVIQASNGKLYGMTADGGSSHNGVIFSFDPATSIYTKVKDFDYTNGGNPSGSLLQASDGKLYGMTLQGGSSSNGVIFSFDPGTFIYTKVKDFDGTDGGYPNGSLVQASNGKLYGMTYRGGSSGLGVIFSFDPATFTYIKLKDFDGTNGGGPDGSLVQVSNGKLYGMTSGGGIGRGVIFSFDPATSVYTKVKDFDYTNGANPLGGLIQANNGKLYGMTWQGGDNSVGVIFSFDPGSSTYTKVKDFDGIDGGSPYGSLLQVSDGKLYGMTSSNIFSFDPVTSAYIKLKEFDIAINGNSPEGSLLQASNGKLYGMTYGGGIGYGVIFSFDPGTSTYTKVKDFGSPGGDVPLGSLLQATNHMLYGITSEGGSSNVGVIFSFDPVTSIYIKVKDFDYITGDHPKGSLVQASNGKLYGMTSSSIFSFDPATFTYTKLKDLNGTNGSEPYGSLVQASNGKLYGMTSKGGSRDVGVIFSFDPVTSIYTKVKDFDYNTNGGYPYGNLVQASNGKLYGMTNIGGSNNYGVIFSFDLASSTYTKLKDFDGTNGRYPYGSLLQATDGKFYGMTEDVIFSFDPATSTYTKIKNFEYPTGAIPYGSLMQASDGKLYGMTYLGGGSNFGVTFSFDPASSTYTKLQDYNGANGAYPSYGSAFIEVNVPVIDIFPYVNIITPANDTTYIAPARIKLKAEATEEDNTISKVEFYNGNTLLHTETEAPYDCIIDDASVGKYTITARAYDGDGKIGGSDILNITVVPDIAPTINITNPVDGAAYPGPANVILSADANDEDGRITKVEFYNGNTLLFTETAAPYLRKSFHLKIGNYSITAKAYDNNGAVTTSAPVHFSVVPDIAPLVSLTSPANGTTFTAPANIELSADASDADGVIRSVDFYNGSILLFTEKYLPYSKTWVNVPAGNYSITAVATDNNEKTTTSAPVNISVREVPAPIARKEKSNILTKPLSLNVSPNPVAKTLNISVEGLQKNKGSGISLLSVSGVVIKTIQSNSLNTNMQLNVSSLSAGVYYIKLISGDKILYRQFVKM